MIKKIPEGFMLGASSSAWQTEGWKGKKEGQDSYLDMWYKEEPFVWHEGYGPAGATEFYERYQEDIDMMKEIGLTHYRTSINWARFFTDYENAVVDEDYAQHISDVVDALIEAGVEPMLCLEHYEVPSYLIEKFPPSALDLRTKPGLHGPGWPSPLRSILECTQPIRNR